MLRSALIIRFAFRRTLVARSVVTPPQPAHGPMPSTIPGVSREELQERLKQFHEKQSQSMRVDREKKLALQIDEMRRALPPEQFQEFLRGLEDQEHRTKAEEEKISAMSPEELFRYQRRQKRKAALREWWSVACLSGAFFGSLAIFHYVLNVWFW